MEYRIFNDNMETFEMIVALAMETETELSLNFEKALIISRNILMDYDIYFYAETLDNLGIRGDKLVTLFEICCNSDYYLFKRTLCILENGPYTKSEIINNLMSTDPIPYVNEHNFIEGIPSIEEDFGPKNLKWDEYCQKQKEKFNKKKCSKLKRLKLYRKIS